MPAVQCAVPASIDTQATLNGYIWATGYAHHDSLLYIAVQNISLHTDPNFYIVPFNMCNNGKFVLSDVELIII